MFQTVSCKNYSYLSDLAGLSIAGPLDLVRTPLGEANAEHPECVIVCRLHIHMSFNQRLPFPYQRPQLVSRKIHALYIQGKFMGLHSRATKIN